MTQPNRSMPPSSLLSLAARPITIGAVIGLLFITWFLSGVAAPDTTWGKLWMLKPLLLVPAAGALGGGFYYFLQLLSDIGIVNKKLAILFSILVYISGLFLGTVLGLDGTLWN